MHLSVAGTLSDKDYKKLPNVKATRQSHVIDLATYFGFANFSAVDAGR